MKPLFSEKHFISKKITLLEGEKVLTDDAEVVETMNSYFSNVTERLDIKGFSTNEFTHDPDSRFKIQDSRLFNSTKERIYYKENLTKYMEI